MSEIIRRAFKACPWCDRFHWANAPTFREANERASKRRHECGILAGFKAANAAKLHLLHPAERAAGDYESEG